MQSSLVFSDINKFVDKYTRFMTKDVYISYDMNKSFLSNYDYLKEELEKNKYLYQERSEYKKFFRIISHSDEMLKLHNSKYLKNGINCYDDFFSSLGYNDVLDKNKKMMVLANESKMVLVVKKNYIPFIVSKIKYMSECLKYDLSKFCVLVSDDKDLELLRKELSIYELDVSLYGLKEYGLSTFQKNESIIDDDVLYEEFVRYMIEMFLDKEKFNSFYKVFSSDIYLNRDYKDFDTFRDYHAYMYKRMFLESKLSLRKFIEREIKKRRRYFKSIDNHFFESKEMVDVANFLYLNSVSYVYDKGCFVCDKDSISFGDGSSIVLDKKSKFLEGLVYELVKRQYGMEKRSDDDVYAMLRDSTVDSYFSEFIRDKLIPSFYYYEENGSFEGTLFDDKQRVELENLYKYYVSFKNKKHYVSDIDVHNRVQDKIKGEKYEYFIMLGNSNYVFDKSHLIVLKDYPKIDLIRSNLRFLYDYKSFLSDKKCLAVCNGYLSMDELSRLTGMFLSSNLNYLNSQIVHSKKRICICFYEEGNKFKCFKNLSFEVLRIISGERDKKICLSLDKGYMKYLINSGYFARRDSNSLECEYGCVDVFDVKSIKKRYDSIIFPFLIKDSYHEGIVVGDDVYRVKVLLFMAFGKCKDRVYLMCPNSKREKYMEVFKNLDVEYYF